MSTDSQTSAVFAVADRIVERVAQLSPILATISGVIGHEAELDDFSPAGASRRLDLYEASLAESMTLTPDGVDDVRALAVMRERLEASRDLERHGEVDRTFGVIDSPAINLRQVFEMMSNHSVEDAMTIVERLRGVPTAVASWRESLEGMSRDPNLLARRHVLGVSHQMREIADGGFDALVRRLAESCGVDVEASGLLGAAESAAQSFQSLSEWMERECAPRCAGSPFAGEERHARWSRYCLGMDVDPRETYEWGWSELSRINERMRTLAKELTPGARTLAESAAQLDHDRRYMVSGTDALLARLRALTDATVERLAGREFAIDESIRFCDVRLAPEGAAAAPYYTPPSEDLSRPGTTWFPTLGQEEFPWWRQVGIWYHEAVPGHHLQIATIVINSSHLSRFQRLLGFTSGWAEGWALYAERLMDELGGFEDPATEMGFLVAQALRAARVVVDIGLHLQLAAPSDFGVLEGLGDVSGQTWTPEMAVETLVQRAIIEREFSKSEVERYLAIPAQAISYKVGEREWLGARDEEKSRLGASFTLRDFHERGLALGPVPLSELRSLLRG
ncbi:MAG: DUF885 domain-containing protein [Acidobacteriota bacterium]|nr:DUF885 domain-containing protein [Acidobacteriota bacterium]